MPPIPFPSSSAPNAYSRQGGRLVNCHAVKLPDGRIDIRSVPGLREIVTVSGYTGFRGGIEVNGVLLAAFEDRLVKVSDNGDGTYPVTDLGELIGTEPVFFARNNKTPTPDIVAVTNSVAYEVTVSSAPTTYSDSDVGSPNAVSFVRGYFVFSYGDGRLRSSELNSVSILTTDTAIAESRPDAVLFPVPRGGEFLAAGANTIEIWRIDPNNVDGFPFSYLDTINRGVVSASAISGFQDGFSNIILFVGDDGIPYRLEGYQPVPILHTPVIEDIARLADKSVITSMVFMQRGHPIWCIRCSAWAWCYDLIAGSWHERISYGETTWRASGTVYAFGKWLAGDADTGKVFEIDPSYRREGGDPLRARVISAASGAFPNRVAIPGLQLNMTAGTGIAIGEAPIQTAPVCEVSWSHDGGVTFGDPVRREIGAQGDYRKAIRVNRLGLATTHGISVMVDVADPVDFSLFGGEFLNAQARGS